VHGLYPRALARVALIPVTPTVYPATMAALPPTQPNPPRSAHVRHVPISNIMVSGAYVAPSLISTTSTTAPGLVTTHTTAASSTDPGAAGAAAAVVPSSHSNPAVVALPTALDATTMQQAHARQRPCPYCRSDTSHAPENCPEMQHPGSRKRRRSAGAGAVGSEHGKGSKRRSRAPQRGAEERHWPRRAPLPRGYTRRCARTKCKRRSIWYCAECTGAHASLDELVYLCVQCFKPYHVDDVRDDDTPAHAAHTAQGTIHASINPKQQDKHLPLELPTGTTTVPMPPLPPLPTEASAVVTAPFSHLDLHPTAAPAPAMLAMGSAAVSVPGVSTAAALVSVAPTTTSLSPGMLAPITAARTVA